MANDIIRSMQTNKEDTTFLKAAFDEAQKGYDEGGVPVGAALVANGKLIALGHNRRVQDGNPIAHGEMDCIKNAGRRPRYSDTTLYTTLSPCMMCAGTIAQFGIRRVVIGENANFGGNEEFLRGRGVRVDILNDEACRALMTKFITERPELWDEDIAGGEDVGSAKSTPSA